MKTTIELPDMLVREIKLRAVHEGRKLKDVMSDLLRKGLDSPELAHSEDPPSRISADKRSGLPVIRCSHSDARDQRLTPERVAEILIGQEAEWHNEAGRH